MTTQAVASRDREDVAPEARERIFVGIDIGYREHVAAAIPLSSFNVARFQDNWKRVKTLHFSSDAAGFKKLRAYLDKFSMIPSDFLVLLEPTGGYYAMTLLIYLISQGYSVLQVENKAVKDYREKIFGSETKTDDTDARLMARMGFLHHMVGEEFSIQPVYLTNPDDAALKVMVRDLVKLQKEITRRRNQLQQVVAVTFPELKAFFPDGTAGKTVRLLLERWPTPQELAAADPADVTALLWSAHAWSHAKRTEELMALAKSSAGAKMMVHHLWRQGWIIKQLPVLEKAREELVGQLQQVIAHHPYAPIIESLPVKSPIWTATLIAVIGNMSRFERYAEFKAYMGWYPKVAKSGTSVNTTGLATKAVRLSRNVLGQMSAVLLSPTMKTTPFFEYYEKLVARGMKAATAKGHMAGKLAVVLYGMLKTMTPYDAKKHRKAMGLPDPEAEASQAPVEAPQELVETLDDEQDALDEIEE
jgi:transposase